MADQDKIRAALEALDPQRDEDWTTSGLPAMSAVQALAGEGVTRAMVTAIAPDFTRATASAATPAPPGLSPDDDPLAPEDHEALAASEPPHVVPRDADPLAEAKARVTWLRRARTAKLERLVEEQRELAQIDEEIRKAEAALAALQPARSWAEQYKAVQRQSTEDRRRRIEAARAIQPVAGRSRLDIALASTGKRGGIVRPNYPITGRGRS